MTNRIAYKDLKPSISALRCAPAGQHGPVCIKEEIVSCNVGDNNNGWKKGTSAETIRRFYVNGEQVSIVDAARVVYSL